MVNGISKKPEQREIFQVEVKVEKLKLLSKAANTLPIDPTEE